MITALSGSWQFYIVVTIHVFRIMINRFCIRLPTYVYNTVSICWKHTQTAVEMDIGPDQKSFCNLPHLNTIFVSKYYSLFLLSAFIYLSYLY